MKKFNIKHSFMLTGFAFMVTTSLFSHQAHAEGSHPIDINFSKDRIDKNTAKSNTINEVNDTSRTGNSMNSDNDLDTDIVSDSDSDSDIDTYLDSDSDSGSDSGADSDSDSDSDLSLIHI